MDKIRSKLIEMKSKVSNKLQTLEADDIAVALAISFLAGVLIGSM